MAGVCFAWRNKPLYDSGFLASYLMECGGGISMVA